MEITMPDLGKVRERLQLLSEAQVKALARLAEVPYSTVQKIRYGRTANPGILTVQALLKQISAAEAADKGSVRKRSVKVKRRATTSPKGV